LKTIDEIIELAKETIRIEADAIRNLENHVNEDFSKLVKFIYDGNGRVVVTGIGKSAIIANKLVATLNSTGTPSMFMHAADAIHGDLGMILNDDVVICISNSGNTPEIKVLVPMLKRIGNKLAALVGNKDSFLAKNADYVLYAGVDKEACPNNLAPTSSTTAQLVMGDALAVSLIKCKGFSSDDFAKFHPGGSLGKRLYIKVGDLLDENKIPKVQLDAELRNVIVEISDKRMGVTAVLNGDKLVGVITDGDIRRTLEKNMNLNGIKANEVMSENPRTIQKNELAVKAFEVMESNNITQLIVVEGESYLGVVHLHDILKEGII